MVVVSEHVTPKRQSAKRLLASNSTLNRNMSSGNADRQDHDKSNEHAVASRSNHDIRASIAITKGFNKALESTLSELSQVLHHALYEHVADTQGESLQRIKGLEEDCLFCVLRINRSLEQLDARLNADARFDTPSSSTEHKIS